MFLIYFISYGCNGGALVFLGGAEASASPSFALPMFITIKKIIILHLFLGVPTATVGGTGTPWHTRGYAPAEKYITVGYISYYNNINFSLHFINAFYVLLQMLLSEAAYNWGTHLNSEAICHTASNIHIQCFSVGYICVKLN